MIATRQGKNSVRSLKLMFSDLGDHQETDHDESGGRGERRDRGEDRREQDGQQEQRGGHAGGQTGPAALGNARGGFDVGRGGGRAEQCARGGRDGVGEQGFLQARHPSVLVQHLRRGGHAGQRAERVEEVVEEQREHHDQEIAGEKEFPSGQVRALLRPFVRVQALAEERAELPERPADAAEVQRGIQRIHLRLGVHLIKPRRLAEHAESPREQDADEDRAFYSFVEQHDRHEESDQRERGADAVRGPGVAERHERGQARAVHDDLSPPETR